MQITASLAILALSSAVVAQLDLQNPDVAISVLNVLATAIPADTISSAMEDPAGFSMELESSISAGQTPSWYQALPSDVKSALPLLYPASTPAATTPPASDATEPPTKDSSMTALPTISGLPTPTNGTGDVSSPTLSPSGTESGLPESTGGAATLNGMVASGVVGAFGILGMLFL
ncbi:hypothetical protein M011DRAFT_478147 [Sporormia fimetaria CBS 119925]|uniref:Uncharacterized protein n=1 Tax=Sporormia fimetaria CBS 119925 TaxID=1340428 RepID=A0A6A6V8Y0_9PLEO|nr:hypothetical protein M011DRAFT_478147 [Sporormia fimetaria CBS 119925]